MSGTMRGVPSESPLDVETVTAPAESDSSDGELEKDCDQRVDSPMDHICLDDRVETALPLTEKDMGVGGSEPLTAPAETGMQRVDGGELHRRRESSPSSNLPITDLAATTPQDSSKLLIVQWIPWNGCTTPISRLTRYVPDSWGYLQPRQPAAFERHVIRRVKTNEITMSAADILDRYGGSIEQDALHEYLQVLMEKAYGPEASAMTSWDQLTVTIDTE